MATNSWPAVGENGLTDSQWVSAAAIGDGIVEDFGFGATEAFKISTINNTTDEITLTPGKCRVAGYVGESETEVLQIPAVASPTTYTIGWCYDPALNVADGGGGRSALGPVRLFVEDGPLDLSGGKRYVILYTITRSASQVLTAAAVSEHRRWVGAAFSMLKFVDPAVDLPRGSQILEISTGHTYLRDANTTGTALEWRNVSVPSAVALPLRSGLVAYDVPPEVFRLPGGMVGLRGTVKRQAAGATFTSNGGSPIIADLPVGYRPARYTRITAGYYGSGDSSGLNITPEGVITLYQPAINLAFLSLDGVYFRTV